VIKGKCNDRAKARDVAASLISLVKKSHLPVVWALTLRFEKDAKHLAKLDILKDLVLQILQINKSLFDDRSQPLRAIEFQCATTESEWFKLLCLALTGLSEIYLIIDIEVLRRDTENGRSWLAAFMDLCQKVGKRSPGTILRKAIISYYTQLSIEAAGLSQRNVIRLDKGMGSRKVTTRPLKNRMLLAR
jgi:hypothetical protein